VQNASNFVLNSISKSIKFVCKDRRKYRSQVRFEFRVKKPCAVRLAGLAGSRWRLATLALADGFVRFIVLL